jgi:hypothetical protein
LPIHPVFTGALDIRILCSFVASAEKQNHLGSCDCVIDPVSRSSVDAQFPYAVPAKPVIAEIAQFNPVNSPVNRNPCFHVAEMPAPFHEYVFLIPRQVMANVVHGPIVVYKRTIFKQKLCVCGSRPMLLCISIKKGRPKAAFLGVAEKAGSRYCAAPAGAVASAAGMASATCRFLETK